jgi:hypothetical protein
MSIGRHIGWEVILEHAEGGALFSPALHAHLERCESCRELLREAENLLGALEIVSAPDPSPELVRRSWLRIRDEQRAQGAAAVGGRISRAVKEIWAALASGTLAPTHAVRGTAAASPRLLVYEAGDFMVSISLKETDHATRSLLGKVVPRAAAEVPPGKVVLWIDRESRETDLGPHGAFRFDGVPRGPIRLDVQVGGTVIHVPPIEPEGGSA